MREVAGSDAASDAGALGSLALRFELVGGDQAVSQHGDAEAVERHGHRVGGEVARARSGAGTGEPLQLVELSSRDQAPFLRADRLPHGLDRHLAAVQPSRAHRPAVEDDGRLVDARERHQRGGNGLVAADEADQRVEVVRVHHQLDRVGDHLTRDQRGAHARRRLRLVVRDRDRVELERDASGGRDAVAHASGELALVQVARHRPGPGRGDADDRAVEPGRIDAHGAEMRARSGALGAGGEALPCTPPQRVVAHGRLNASCRG